jgi:hypothetical protein
MQQGLKPPDVEHEILIQGANLGRPRRLIEPLLLLLVSRHRSLILVLSTLSPLERPSLGSSVLPRPTLGLTLKLDKNAGEPPVPAHDV